MPAAQNERPSRAGQKWAKWTEEEDKALLRLREADSTIALHTFCQNYQVYFPDRSEGALEQRFGTLRNREKGKGEDRRRSLVVTLKIPKRPLPTTETMAQPNPSKQPRPAGQHDGGMDCDIAPPIQIGQILPQNSPQYPQYIAPQSATTVPPRYAFQQPNAPGIPPFQPAFSSGSYRPVVPTAGQTAQYPHSPTSFIQQTPQIPVQRDTVMSGTNFNNNPVPQAPPPAAEPAATKQAQSPRKTHSTTIADSLESSEADDSDDTSSTTDSELPEPDSLFHHGPARPRERSKPPQQTSSSGEGRTSAQKKTTPKKAEEAPSKKSIPPALWELLGSLSADQLDELQFSIIVRHSQMRELKNIYREGDTAELGRRVEELEKQLNTQKKQICSLESAGSQHVAALEKRVADLEAQGTEDRRRLEKVRHSLRE